MLDQYDVFISYSHEDGDWVHDWLLPKLEDAKFAVCIDDRDFDVGVPSVVNIEHAVENSRKTLLVLTPNWMDSEWTEFESLLVGTSDPAGRKTKLLPLMLEKCQLPPRIRMLTHADFTVPEQREMQLSRIISAFDKVQESTRARAIVIPFVVFAMNQQEVNQLLSKEVFDDHTIALIERERFESLIEILLEQGLDDISKFYGPAREDWRPPIASGATIRDIIAEVVKRPDTLEGVVKRLRQDVQFMQDPSLISPQFFSTEFFSDDITESGRIWRQLRDFGYVLILDAISMFHPLLRRKLLRSEFGGNKRISIAVISPVASDIQSINQLFEKEIFPEMQQAFDRFAVELDKLCEFGVSDVRALNRWLFFTLPETAEKVQGLTASPARRKKMRAELGEPAGIDKVVFGRVETA